MQAIGEEGDEDVSLDALDQLMVDRAQLQVVLEILEGGLDFGELGVEPPQLRRLASAKIGAQQIAAFAPSHLAEFLAIERIAECGDPRVDLDIDETPGRPRFGARRAELHEQFFAGELHRRELFEPRHEPFQLARRRMARSLSTRALLRAST